MGKAKKSRKDKKYTPRITQVSSIRQAHPKGHRFDKEIADICSTILLRVQMRKLEKPVSIERDLRKEIKKTISQHEMSHIAHNFFATIITIGDKNPFVRSATRILNATYKEYIETTRHLKAFNHISIQARIDAFLEQLRQQQWHVENFTGDVTNIKEVPLHFIAIEDEWHALCDDNGRLLTSLSLAVHTDDLYAFSEYAYQKGLLLHKIASKNGYYHLKIHPDNNVPGAIVSPQSIQVEPAPSS